MIRDVLVITEASEWGRLAVAYLQCHVHNLAQIVWQRGDPRPSILGEWSGDWILSFKSDLVLSQRFLKRAKRGSINFHPSPPEYRGIGGHYWAIENQDDMFGVTCHHMISRVDFGTIVEVRRFAVLPMDTPSSLKMRADANCLTLFYDTVATIALGEELAKSTESWNAHLYTYEELGRLLARSASGQESGERFSP